MFLLTHFFSWFCQCYNYFLIVRIKEKVSVLFCKCAESITNIILWIYLFIWKWQAKYSNIRFLAYDVIKQEQLKRPSRPGALNIRDKIMIFYYLGQKFWHKIMFESYKYIITYIISSQWKQRCFGHDKVFTTLVYTCSAASRDHLRVSYNLFTTNESIYCDFFVL